ncbi:MAG: CDP-alcohol phosphatidyltransferase family protein [Oscillospiraceae bacterium]|jgi:phosphatidylglycerophosphate synthase|nr:CDP-alcohol phosphatidyltransferase family protein [Oscillospiraceae bacterium]
MKLMKHVPNILSALRILLSVSLLFLTAPARIPVFVAVYLFNGLTDVLDGKIARRFHAESALGSKLDAVGDSMLFGAAAVCMIFLADLKLWLPVSGYLAVLAPGVAYKIANVFVTRARFGQWNMMHTILNRAVFVTLYFYVPVFLLLGEVHFGMVLAISALICLACFEETVTLLRLDEYDVNCKGVVGEKVAEKLAKRPAA